MATRDPELPLGVLLAVLGFLLVQARIDRKDPKLAGLSSTDPDDGDLVFGAPLRRPAPLRLPSPPARLRTVVVARSLHHTDPSALPARFVQGLSITRTS